MKTNLAPLAVLALSALLISGCQVAPPQPPAAGTGAEQAQVQSPAVKPDPPQPPAEMPIPGTHCLRLVLLRERQLDPALAILTEQALKLDDAALARRALRLAEFRQDDAKSHLAVSRLSWTSGMQPRTGMGLLIKAEARRGIVFARTAKERGARINAPALLVSWTLPPDKRRAVASAVEALAEDWPQDQDIAIAGLSTPSPG